MKEKFKRTHTDKLSIDSLHIHIFVCVCVCVCVYVYVYP